MLLQLKKQIHNNILLVIKLVIGITIIDPIALAIIAIISEVKIELLIIFEKEQWLITNQRNNVIIVPKKANNNVFVTVQIISFPTVIPLFNNSLELIFGLLTYNSKTAVETDVDVSIIWPKSPKIIEAITTLIA